MDLGFFDDKNRQNHYKTNGFSMFFQFMKQITQKLGSGEMIIQDIPYPNLYCIDVDDFQYSYNNWFGIDAHSYFSEDCSAK